MSTDQRYKQSQYSSPKQKAKTRSHRITAVVLSQNRDGRRKIPRLPIMQQSEPHTVPQKAENWDSEEAYKKVANEGKRVSDFEIKRKIKEILEKGNGPKKP